MTPEKREALVREMVLALCEETDDTHVSAMGMRAALSVAEAALNRAWLAHVEELRRERDAARADKEKAFQTRAALTIVDYFARRCLEGACTPADALTNIREMAAPWIDVLTDDQIKVIP